MYNLHMHAMDFDLNKTNSQVFHLNGNDAFFVKKMIQSFKDLVPDEEKGLNVTTFGDVNKNIDDIEVVAGNISFFPSALVIIIESSAAKITKDTLVKLTRIFEELDDKTYVILNNLNIDKRLAGSKFNRMVEEIKCSFDAKYELSLINVLQNEVKKSNIKMPALKKILKFCSYDVGHAIIEVEKLVAYQSDDEITMQLVDVLVADSTENKIYEFSDALARGLKNKALDLTDSFLGAGFKRSYLMLSLIDQYRRMLYAKITGYDNKILAELLNAHEYSILKAREVARKYSAKQLKSMLDKMVDCEFMFKSGQMSEELAFDIVISTLIAS